MAPKKEIVAVGDKSLATINPEQTLKASKALLAHIKKAANQKALDAEKRNLLDDTTSDAALGSEDANETPIWLTLTTKRHIVDKTRLQPGKIPLPHSLLDVDGKAGSSEGESGFGPTTTICLITADPQRAYKDIVASEEFPEELRKRVTRVIGFEKLKAKFTQYEAQRKLFSEHDVFLADDRIINRLPKVLGKTFFKTTLKRPIPVVLAGKPLKKTPEGKKAKRPEGQINAATPAQIAREIEKALGSALVSLSPTTNTAVRIGYAGWTPEQIAANVEAVVAGLVEKFVPQKWKNVKSIYIKGPETAALPIWLTDELWLDDKDVISNEAAAAAIQAADEKKAAAAGKKRKAIGNGAANGAEAEDEEQEEGEEDEAPKQKKSRKTKQLPDGDDDNLNKQITARKASLRKQKAAAKKAMDD